MKNLLNEIVQSGGILCGGFVRDYLIRGGQFNDIDFFFKKDWPEPFQSWERIRTVKGNETAQKIFNGVKYHCLIVESTDLSSNVFCFDGIKLYPRPLVAPIDYVQSFRFIFENKYTLQVPSLKNLRLEAKLKKKGWERAGIVYVSSDIATPPSVGPWSDFTLAKERFDAL
jgi:hypothetical protein